ncbi:MAG: baseplate J/gp47 family protein [Ktedonobacteraceae bacterium]|nr:baseplate J/gp47 family protein [Ktedonobacteraceae bacterium]
MHDHHIQQQVDALLAELEQPAQQDVPAGPTRLIDIHVYDLPAQEEQVAPTVEGTLHTQEQDASAPDTHEDSSPITPPPRRRHFPLVVGALGLLAVALLLGIALLLLLVPTATVTVVPVSRLITATTALHLVTGPASPTAHQLPGRLLDAVTMSEARTVATTGVTHQQAQAAHGLVTFYNGAPFPQMVAAGTLITASDGIQVVTEHDALIPAVAYPTLGQVTVPAVATVTGPAGNLGAADIYGPCCRLNVSAVNSAFTGGHDARIYASVGQQDISSVATSLQASLNTAIQATLDTHVQADETLLVPLPCQQQISPDHAVGSEARQVQVTVSETCQGAVYQTQVYQALLSQVLTQAATQQLGAGYSRVGAMQAAITRVTMHEHGTFDLEVKAAGTWLYQFTATQREQLKQMIAGKTKAQATALLLHVPGVSSVAVSLTSGTSLPTHSSAIQVVIIAAVWQEESLS